MMRLETSGGFLAFLSRRFIKRRASVGTFAAILGLFVVQAEVSAIDVRLLHHKQRVTSEAIGEQSNVLSPTRPAARPPETETSDSFGFGVFWSPLGPSPIPNGQTLPFPGSPELPVSGRVTAIAIDPHDSNVVYVAGAQGGAFRTLDGGQTWLELMAGAKNVAIGSITIDPSDPDDLLVGTGEGNFSGDSHFGVGVYVIEHAKSSSPRLKGPFGLDASGHEILSFRSITQIIVSPTDHNIVFCATSSAFGGLGSASGPAALRPPRGLYRSTNFFSGSPTFTRLTVGPGTDTRVTSAVLDPTNPNHLVCSIYGLVTDSTGANLQGGVFYTNNALAPVPVFTRSTIVGTRTVDGNLPLGTNVKLAAGVDGKKVVVLAATSELALKKNGKEYADQGVVRKSTDGGVTFPTTLPSGNGFAGGQGFYNIAIAIDQSNSKNVYLAGTLSSTGVDPDGGKKPIRDDGGLSSGGPGGDVTDPVNGTGPKNSGGTFQYSRNGGATFVPSVKGLHVDSHAIAIAPSAPNVVWTGNDGGVWKSTDGGKTWIDENVFGFVATQFESVALHPSDPNFSIGGTQDNGTEFFQPDRSFVRADFGDGGYALIDQSAKDTENVTMYHTYFNATGAMIGFARTTKASCATEGQWSFMGVYPPPIETTVHCDGFKDTFNGINITDTVNFYAPMALGPGHPNTVYFGTDRLYRSSDRGTTMRVVSQAPLFVDPFGNHVPISAIGIAPQSDKIRLVGLNNSRVFGTSTGSSTLVDVTGPIIPSYVTRIEIDPTNANVAYVALNGYGLPSGQQIWKTTNLVTALNAGKIPNWAPSSNGIPDVSVNAVVVDPARPSDLYAGTDRGVWASTNGGASWKRYGVFLPNVEVYDVKVHGKFHLLRAATHGLGMWEAPALSLFGPAPSP
jgi:hypothetical protein